jgi:hypothetical protein
MANFPAALDDNTSLPNPSGSATQNNPDHGSLHTQENNAIRAIEAKVGTSVSTPVSNTIFKATGSGTSAWGNLSSAELASIMTDETGSGQLVFANTPTLVTPKTDIINEATAGNGVTIDGVLLKDAKVDGSYITNSTVGNSQLASGLLVQAKTARFSAVSTTTALIPSDDTIPQITEGTEFMTLSYTPRSATNVLLVTVTIMYMSSVANNLIVALFRDSTTDAFGVADHYQSGGGGRVTQTFSTWIAATSTSTSTFRVRAGQQLAGTMTINGFSGSRIYGATPKSFIQVIEYKN